MEISKRNRGDWTILEIDGNIRGRNAIDIKEICHEIIESGTRKLAVNFAKILSIDSTGLGGLISCHQRMQGLEGKMALMNLSDDIYDLFTMTSIDKLFPIVDSEAELKTLD